MPKTFLKQISDDVFALKIAAYQGKNAETTDLNYYRNLARKMLTGTCGVYSICDGQRDRVCTGQKFGAPIGMGGVGQSRTFETNYNSLYKYRLKMRVVKAHHEPEMSLNIFGKDLVAPIMGASLSGVRLSLNDTIPEKSFYLGLLNGAKTFGSVGLVGNTPTTPEYLGVNTMGEDGGWDIPIFKPQSQQN